MGLTLPTPPGGTEQLISDALKRAHASGRFAPAGVLGGAAVVTPSTPHQAYNLGLNQLMAGEGLAAAKLGGWRALVLQGSKPVAAVEFIGGSGDPKDFKSLNQGPYVQGTVSALAAAEAAAQVIQNDFEPRVLQIPSIYLMALWLHGSGENLFVPMEPAPGRLKANQIYTEAKFFREAFDLASRRKQFDDRPKGEPPAAAPGPR